MDRAFFIAVVETTIEIVLDKTVKMGMRRERERVKRKSEREREVVMVAFP